MNSIITYKKSYLYAVFSLLAVLAVFSQSLSAQHGHPLVGSWSGFMNRDEGTQMRVLLTMDFGVDQVISGNLIVNGRRYPLTSATLNHENWSVAMTAEGQDRSGNTLRYQINADIENLDSPTLRTLAGTWREGSNAGEFHVVIN